MLNKLVLILRDRLKHSLLPVWSQVSRKKLFDRAGTIQILEDKSIYRRTHNSFILPGLRSLNGTAVGSYQTDQIVNLDDDYVWQIDVSDQFKSLQIYRSGIPVINNKVVLDVDFGTHGAALNSLPYRNKPIKYPSVVAPWSHSGGSYYEFVFNILAKLCRIEEALGKEIWKTIKICYPLRHSTFERQYFEMLGISAEALVDSRASDTEIQTDRLILANSQHQRTYPSPYDMQLLREKFLPLAETSTMGSKKRIFLARRGRRTITNEAEVRELLKTFGFEIVEDSQRSVKEQICLFKQDSVIVAPHGAALSNLLWCDPGTKIIECFSGGYVNPYHYYVATVLGLDYMYMVDRTDIAYSWFNTIDNISVDVIRKHLESNL